MIVAQAALQNGASLLTKNRRIQENDEHAVWENTSRFQHPDGSKSSSMQLKKPRFGADFNGTIRKSKCTNLTPNHEEFTQTYLTASSCSLSRNSIFSGLYPHNTGAAELHTEPQWDCSRFLSCSRSADTTMRFPASSTVTISSALTLMFCPSNTQPSATAVPMTESK